MAKAWDEAELQRHITDCIEEDSELEYKAAASLGKQNDKTTEITKDVSAMANSAGGTIIYGIKEFPRPRNHLPEKIDPIDRSAFSKEWLEHIINTIHPPLSEFKIAPVNLVSGPNDVCYVVEIPQGRTAYQCRDYRYYKRYNFESVPMEDYEVRLVMNRQTTPDVSLEFRTRPGKTMAALRYYLLSPIIRNLGNQVIRDFKLIFTFPAVAYSGQAVNPRANVNSTTDANRNHVVSFQSSLLLFPEDERDLGDEMGWEYSIHDDTIHTIQTKHTTAEELLLTWKLYADNMSPKEGTWSIYDLHPY